MSTLEENQEDTFEFKNKDYDGGATKGHPPKVEVAGVPQMFMDNANKILPMAMKAVDVIEKAVVVATPFVNKGIGYYQQFYDMLKPYGADEIMTCFTGLVMIFFGGSFSTLTAVYEAVVQAGAAKFKATLNSLYQQYQRFKAENVQDDQEDLDNDGIADVGQISGQQYAMRKSLLFLRATDPQEISHALQQLYTIFIAVLATLRLRFARTLSLGAAIGDQITQVYEKFVQPQLEKVTDAEYHKWLGPVGGYVSRLIGVMVAFRIQRILTTVHTSVKGGRLLSHGLTLVAERNGYGYLTAGYLDEMLSAVLAVTGIIVQLFMWSTVPVIIRLALFPLFFVEGILSLFVSVGLTMSSPSAAA